MGILKKTGVRVDAVANGREAVTALEQIPYDLVLMDVQMPVMDGLTATRTIRDPSSRVRNHYIPIVAMTAHAMKSDRDRCFESGMNDYLTKPMSPGALADVLTKWLQPDDSFKQESGSGAKSVAVEGFIPQLFDPDDFMNRMMDDIEMARVIIEGFMEMSPGLLAQIATHIRQGETREAGQTAHSLKGSAGNLSASPLADLAFRMECAGKDGDLARLTALLPEIQRCFDQLADELTKWLSVQNA